MKSLRKISLAALAVVLSVAVIGVGGCNSKTEEAETSQNDNDAKSMVLDILHTKEGMETLRDIVRDPRLKQSFTITKQDVQSATIKSLSDTQTNMNLLEQMKNPRFGATLTKAYRNDNKNVLKIMMQDPQYQTMMLTMLKSPDFQLLLLDLMKTPEYRKAAVTIMSQAMQNPDFKLQFLAAIKKSIHGSQGGQQQQAKSQSAGQGQGQGQDQEQKDQKDKSEKDKGGQDQGDDGGGS